MDYNQRLLKEAKQLLLDRYPSFAGEIAGANLSFKSDLKYHTAATDGKDIFFDPEYLANLSDDEKVFLIAHELMHIKFKHMFRLIDKNGKPRNMDLWNKATDAIINALLEQDGLPMKKGYVSIPGALQYTAEQLYDKLFQQLQQQMPGGVGQERDDQQPAQGQGQGQGEEDQDQNQDQDDQQQGQGQGQGQGEDQDDQQQSQGQGQGQGKDQDGQQQGQGKGKGQGQDKDKQNQQGGGQGQEQEQQDGQGGDDHSLWEEAFKKYQAEQNGESEQEASKNKDKDKKEGQGKTQGNKEDQEEQEKNKENQQQNKNQDEADKDGQDQQDKNQSETNEDDEAQNSNNKPQKQDLPSQKPGKGNPADRIDRNIDGNANSDGDYEIDERELFKKITEKRDEILKSRGVMKKLKDEQLRSFEDSYGDELGKIGEEKALLDWKLLLRREFDKEESKYSQRRSVAENNYAYRKDDVEEDDEAVTEVMIDVSGSVSDEMVRSFLRQLKPLLKESRLKVGFFADRTTKNFVEVKTNRDIDRLRIPNVGCGTDVDAAVRAFSKKREVNKIVFTDGYAYSPKEDLKNVNVIWLVYENYDNFHPCCGKVINVYPKDLRVVKCQANTQYDPYEDEDGIQ